MSSAVRNKVYISIGEWQYKLKYSIPYTGYVIGAGYAYVEYKSVTEKHRTCHARTAYQPFGSAFPFQPDTPFFDYNVVAEQHLITDEDAIRESFPPVANPEDNAPELPRLVREVIATNPLTALEIGRYERGSNNISTTVVRFQTRDGLKGGWEGEASEQNAFRHVLWQSYITHKYGHQIASDVGNAHESNPNADISKRHFSARGEADQVIDLLNNQIGRNLGGNVRAKTPMNTMALLVLEKFHSDGFYTGVLQDDGTYYIDRTTITDEQYEQLKVIFQSLNSLGRTSEEQTKQDAVEQEKLESMQRTWGTMK